MFSYRLLLGSVVVGAGFGFAADAAAHIRLSDPLARYEITGSDTGIKGCPCGLATGGGNSNRTCNVEMDGSDPARDDDRASTFPAGSTITLKFEEYVGHAGRYRVAFDPDGADFDDFNANVIHDETDPSGSDGNIGDGTKWEIEVTLPDTPCDNCTLQLLQVMAGGTENPVDSSKLATLSTYYACIDLTLTAPEGNTTDEESSEGSTDEPSSSGSETSANESSGGESDSEGTSSSSVETTTAPSTSHSTQVSTDNEETSSTGAAPTSAPTSTATATTAPTTSAAITSTVGTTSTASVTSQTAPFEADTLGDEVVDEEGGCSVAMSREPSSALLALFGVAVLGALGRRRRR